MFALFGAAVVGFIAQLIGGTIGMAFGVTATSGLMALSYSPAIASSVVHLVEIGTSLLNGTFHSRMDNVDWKAVLRIGLPGAVGAFIGALMLSRLDLSFTKPWTASLLLLLGFVIIWRFLAPSLPTPRRRAKLVWLAPLGAGAGFVDATAGGGWGIITTSTLMASNTLVPARVVGTTSTARFFVAVAGSIGFLIGIGAEAMPWSVVLAMLLGGVIAAPIAARLVRVANSRLLGLATGVVVVVLNVRQLAVSAHSSLEVVLLWMLLATLAALAPIAVVAVLRRRRSRATAPAASR